MSSAPPSTGRARLARVVATEPRLAERARGRARRRWRRIGVVALVAAVIAGLVWLIGFSSVLAVRHVEVEGVTGDEANAVAALADVPLGVPLVQVDTDAITERVRGRITIAEAQVSRSWPSTITVTVAPRTARVAVRSTDGTLQLADASGVLFQAVEQAPEGLPVVTVTQEGGPDRDSVLAALSVVTTLPADLAQDVSTIEVSSAHRVTFVLGEITVVWGGKEQPERKVALLRALLPTAPASIDVSVPDSPTTT